MDYYVWLCIIRVHAFLSFIVLGFIPSCTVLHHAVRFFHLCTIMYRQVGLCMVMCYHIVYCFTTMFYCCALRSNPSIKASLSSVIPQMKAKGNVGAEYGNFRDVRPLVILRPKLRFAKNSILKTTTMGETTGQFYHFHTHPLPLRSPSLAGPHYSADALFWAFYCKKCFILYFQLSLF